MKKFLLLGMVVGALNGVSAQTIWSDNFDDQNVSDWTLIDADDDGLDWGDIFQVNNTAGQPVSPVSLISRSWQQVPLAPDNWAISPAIDLTTVTGTVTLNWKVQAAAAAWNEENYSVYAAVGNTITLLEASPVTFTEVYPGDATGPQLTRTLDLSSLAGQTVHVAFRHHDVVDQDWLSIDDVSVTTSLSTENFFKSNFAMYPNPAVSQLNLSSKSGVSIKNAQVTDINGRVVMTAAFDTVNGQLNVAGLNSGVYFITVESESGKGTAKFVKK